MTQLGLGRDRQDGDLFVHFEARATFAGQGMVWQSVDRFELDGEQAARGVGFFDPGPDPGPMRRAVEAAR
jgi:hypothetical protein